MEGEHQHDGDEGRRCGPEFEAVAIGKDGLADGMKKGAALFDLTTNSPTVIRRLQQAYAEKGIHLLDAPVRLRCRTAHRVSIGDHVGVIGEPLAIEHLAETQPLLRFQGRYTSVA